MGFVVGGNLIVAIYRMGDGAAKAPLRSPRAHRIRASQADTDLLPGLG